MNNNQPLVSVIVPVYKVEAFLSACIDSVLTQTYSNLELILVDDGSPDRCGEICDAYAEKDHRIRVIHKENGAMAKARNTGLSYVTGDCIFFLDSDDVLETHAFEVLVAVMLKYDADMVCGNTRCIDEAGGLMGEQLHPTQTLCMDTQQALVYYTPLEWGPWNRLIRAEVHRNISFPNYRIHEDEAIKFRLLERCRIVVQAADSTYFYRQRANSITASNIDRSDMFYSRSENLRYLRQSHPVLVPLFLPKVCEDAILNLSILNRGGFTEDDRRISDILDFFRTNRREIMACRYATKSQKLRCMVITCSNWKKKDNLYTRFYSILDRLRKR